MLHTHRTLPMTRFCGEICLIATIFTVLLPLLQFFHNALLYQRYLIEAGEVWRIWTGSLVHTNYWHLTMNLAGFWILALIQQQPPSKWAFLGQIVFIATGVGAGLWFMSTEVIWYAGFSGVLYGLFLLAGIHLLALREWVMAAIILAGICGKTLWDWLLGGETLSADLIEAPVIYAAHVYGMASALLLGISTLLRTCRKP